ncbi:unnamed protein product [Clonostachys rosea f. rosea IK726]|uniref:Uncharacterized protein n=1 Tax=Clonostachys rosea f. rosea IK726 TaxID=1349383 RepID=A0ACA9UK57_BIOOC|nr:unnamed protein product [Clonostachys rosea f. rosea IK726]
MAVGTQPEAFFFKPTNYIPNSQLPVLLYRKALPLPLKENLVKEFLESNNWIHGGTWNAVPRHHFHPNTHECYAVVKGSSELLIGVGPLDSEAEGEVIHVESGDVIVLPAGVSHCSKSFSEDYRYIGAYPKGSLEWKNEYGRDQSRFESLALESSSVNVPDWDPVNGHRGPLSKLWRL